MDITEYRRERREMLEVLELLATSKDRFRLLKAAEHYGKQEREDFERRLEMLTSLLRDLFLLSAGGQRELVINVDAMDRLVPLAQKVSVHRLIHWAEKFDELRASLKVNINRQIATEALLLALAES